MGVTVQPAEKADRLKIALRREPNGPAEALETAKQSLQKIHGRELTWDEFITLLLSQYVDLPVDHDGVKEVRGHLTAAADALRKHREAQAADIVDLFADALVGVLRGTTPSGKLFNAILDVD